MYARLYSAKVTANPALKAVQLFRMPPFEKFG